MNYPSEPREPLSTCEHENAGVAGLAAGTLVTTPDDDKKIEEIKAGDLVLSGIGEHYAGFYAVRSATLQHYAGPLLHISIKSGNRLGVTPHHTCFGSLEIEPIEGSVGVYAFAHGMSGKLSHQVFTSHPSTFSIGEFDNLDRAEEAARARAQAVGGSEVRRFAYLSFDDDFGFMAATDLRIGMNVPVAKVASIKLPNMDDSWVKSSAITNITEEHYDGLVYALEVPEARNFAAHGVLVHDSKLSFTGRNSSELEPS
jgi:hypothetical protein